MDPNANLQEQREAWATIRAIEQSSGPEDRKDAAISALTDRIAQLAEAMDEWLSKAGARPAAWDHAPPEPEEVTVDRAFDIIRRDYQEDVESVVEDLKRAIKDGEVDDEEAAQDWLHETIDGHGRVIYTVRAKLGLLASRNENAHQEDFGTAPDGPSQAMYSAMRADVMDAIGDVEELFVKESDDE